MKSASHAMLADKLRYLCMRVQGSQGVRNKERREGPSSEGGRRGLPHVVGYMSGGDFEGDLIRKTNVVLNFTRSMKF